MSSSARATFETYGREINAHDFDRLVPLVARDATFWFSSGSHHGIDEARRAFEKTWSTIREEVYSISDVKWIAESDSVAVCTYRFSWSGLVNGERREGGGRGTSCFRRDDEGWRIVHEHLSA
jgi:ketosteroid isomerase-like protein